MPKSLCMSNFPNGFEWVERATDCGTCMWRRRRTGFTPSRRARCNFIFQCRAAGCMQPIGIASDFEEVPMANPNDIGRHKDRIVGFTRGYIRQPVNVPSNAPIGWKTGRQLPLSSAYIPSMLPFEPPCRKRPCATARTQPIHPCD